MEPLVITDVTCPFCLNAMSWERVSTTDCDRRCLVCPNCGLRTPGCEISEGREGREHVRDWFADIQKAMAPKWNPENPLRLSR